MCVFQNAIFFPLSILIKNAPDTETQTGPLEILLFRFAGYVGLAGWTKRRDHQAGRTRSSNARVFLSII